MTRIDAAAFLATAFAVVMVNAALAVLIGCSLYILRAAYLRLEHHAQRVPRLQIHGKTS